ncbi:MAG TPA: MFS transporter [Bacteroidia bacterium]|nr:MFS transporter [Bacteroidia bacterium]
MLKKGDPKVIRAWTFYDWANSVYPLVISSAIFPIYYEAVVKKDLGGRIAIGGASFNSTEFYSYIAAISYIIVALSSPVLSGIADFSGSKKKFLRFFCFLGAGCCMLLGFFSTQHILLSMLALMFASVGYWGSLVFYNAYLPEIAPPEDQDKVSARGFGMGYFGSSLLLILILVLAVFTHVIPHIRYSFFLVGLWWIGFAQITFRRLPKGKAHENKTNENIVTKGYRELRLVFRDILTRKQLRRFLGSYFMYNMGVQTVMIMATLFATEAVDWQSPGDVQSAIVQVQADAKAGKITMVNGAESITPEQVRSQIDAVMKLNRKLSDTLSAGSRTAAIRKNIETVQQDMRGTVAADDVRLAPGYADYLADVYQRAETLAEGHESQSLIISILLIQFLGMAGAFLMSRLSRVIGNLKTIGIVIFLWILICYGTFQFVYKPVQFYIVAASVGLVMGGIQSMSRSTYSKMLPETEDHASYFSFFDVSEKIGLAIGTMTFGLIAGITGGIRQSVLSLIVIFVLGFLLLLRVPKSQNVR